MNKTVKGVAKTALAVTGVATGISALVYEFVLSKRGIEFNKNHQFFVNEDDVNAITNNTEFFEGQKWFSKVSPKPTAKICENGERIYSYIARQTEKSNKWAVVIHGYTDEPRGMANYGRRYFEKGYNVLFPCLRAHSIDTNKYCSMGYYDRYMVCDWVDYIVKEDPDCEIVLHGVSMGGATTMLVTGENLPQNVVCAVADCGYTTCYDEYKAQIGNVLHLPEFPFLPMINTISKLRGNFDFKACAPIEAVKMSKTPTLFVHGEKDTFVPYYMMDMVYDACSAEKDKLSVPDATHAASALVHPEFYWDKVSAFISKYTKKEVETGE